MIARMWHGWTNPQNADSYEKLLRDEMFPSMRRIHGFRGAYCCGARPVRKLSSSPSRCLHRSTRCGSSRAKTTKLQFFTRKLPDCFRAMIRNRCITKSGSRRSSRYSTTEATAGAVLIGHSALPKATAYTAAIKPKPAVRLTREAIQPTVMPRTICKSVPKK